MRPFLPQFEQFRLNRMNIFALNIVIRIEYATC